MKTYDYIITGAGASGLMLAYRMATDPFFRNTHILLIDTQKKNSNDRTWCYWGTDTDDWDAFIHKRWNHIRFASPDHTKCYSISPCAYKMIRSQPFYAALWQTIDNVSHIAFAKEKVLHITETSLGVQVQTAINTYTGHQVINSILLKQHYQNQQKYPVLQQHFLGWFIKTKDPFFDTDRATLMDFELPQQGHTRFMYVLPLSKTEALVEYTLFSKKLLPETEYETAIQQYLSKRGVTDYQILEKEKGAIPMTCYKFDQHNSKNILHIGTAGGWTKASTGYTFKNSTKKTRALVEFLKHENKLSNFSKRNRFWYYDLLFLDVLARYNEQGVLLFSSMFRKGNTTTILKFLDEETSFSEELKTMLCMPKWPFIKTLFLRIFGLKTR